METFFGRLLRLGHKRLESTSAEANNATAHYFGRQCLCKTLNILLRGQGRCSLGRLTADLAFYIRLTGSPPCAGHPMKVWVSTLIHVKVNGSNTTIGGEVSRTGRPTCTAVCSHAVRDRTFTNLKELVPCTKGSDRTEWPESCRN